MNDHDEERITNALADGLLDGDDTYDGKLTPQARAKAILRSSPELRRRLSESEGLRPEETEPCPTCMQPVPIPQRGDHDYGLPLRAAPAARAQADANLSALRVAAEGLLDAMYSDDVGVKVSARERLRAVLSDTDSAAKGAVERIEAPWRERERRFCNLPDDHHGPCGFWPAA